MVRMLDSREATTSSDFNAIRISIASPEQIRGWSSGEVQKGETINYRTQRPEKDGLFCEKIFGPTKDWECQCGKYKRQKYKGVVCDRCGVEVTRSNVRRQRLGHIALAAPVANIWFVKNTPSVMSLNLDLKLSDLTRVLYYSAYVINQVDVDLMREQFELHESEVERIRNGLIPTADGSLQSLANRIADWDLENRRNEAAGALGDLPGRLSDAVANTRSALARLSAAEPDSDEDYSEALQSVREVAEISAAAHAAIMTVGLNVLQPEDLESPERLSVLAVDGDPVAAAISRFYHGPTSITHNIERLNSNATAVVSAFSAWRDDPTEERQDDVADASDILLADLVAVDDEVLVPTLNDLHSIFVGSGLSNRRQRLLGVPGQ